MVRLVSFVKDEGILPLRLLCEMSNEDKPDMFPSSAGIGPEKSLLLRSRLRSMVNSPSSEGKGPVKPLKERLRVRRLLLEESETESDCMASSLNTV